MKTVTIIQTKRNGWFIPEMKAKLTWDFNDESEKFESDYSEEMNYKRKYNHSTTLDNASEVIKEWYANHKEESEKIKIESELIFEKKINDLLANQPIPVTVDNLRIVMQYLNGQNWGTWKLPSMVISYKAAQYDCDGVTATTITLDRPISDKYHMIENETKFSWNAPMRHLSKYRSL